MSKTYSQYVRIALVRENADRERKKIKTPEDVYELLPDLRTADRERLIGIYLDARIRINAIEEISVGTVSASHAHPREVFKTAILTNASYLILAHNHPSGIVEPSREDIGLTERLVKAGQILGIPVVDHVVIGDGEYFSFSEKGRLAEPEGKRGEYL